MGKRIRHKSYAPSVLYEIEFYRTTMPLSPRRSAERRPDYPALIYYREIADKNSTVHPSRRHV
jgi:hypothetical protein